MSALIIGKGSCIGAIRDILLGSGFDAVYYQGSNPIDAIDELNIKGYGKLDMLILIKEAVDESNIQRIFRGAISLDIPVILW